jgi:hypothetical protein
MESETLNQYTTLLGYYNGFHENDPTARYLLSISPVLETTLVLSIPLVLISMAYQLGMRWTPSTPNRKRLQTITTFSALALLVILAITTTYYAISDLITLHAYHII